MTIYVCTFAVTIVIYSGWRLNFLGTWIDGREVFMTNKGYRGPSKTICC